MNALTPANMTDNKPFMITCRHKHAKAKKSLIKGTKDFRTL
jgi:hypothetical protein